MDGLLHQLTREWDLYRHDQHELGQWAAQEAALRCTTSLDGLIATLHRSRHPQSDPILLALLRQHQQGSTLAGRTLVQALLPRLDRLSRSLATTVGAPSLLDCRSDLITHLWLRLTEFRAEDTRSHIALQVTWEAYAKARADYAPPAYPLDPAALPTHTITVTSDPPPALIASLSDYLDSGGWISDILPLDEVLAWATAQHIIRQRDADLLRSVYLTTRTARTPLATLTSPTGASYSSVRQRCSRARRTLTARLTTAA